KNIFFLILNILISILFFYLLIKEKQKYLKLSLILILAGAIGNIIDRIIYGYVIDFIDFRIWPVFNLSDTYITIGGAIILLSFLWKKEPSG
ncbi:MAG: signal peptidase II, partial [Caldiserica bacterium]